tara:strand:- start:9 stop:485 length:477 start_codon:yes stop_codon:yes gene_type:complete
MNKEIERIKRYDKKLREERAEKKGVGSRVPKKLAFPFIHDCTICGEKIEQHMPRWYEQGVGWHPQVCFSCIEDLSIVVPDDINFNVVKECYMGYQIVAVEYSSDSNDSSWGDTYYGYVIYDTRTKSYVCPNYKYRSIFMKLEDAKEKLKEIIKYRGEK